MRHRLTFTGSIPLLLVVNIFLVHHAVYAHPSGLLRGTVNDDTGAPLENVEVLVFGKEEQNLSLKATTDDLGRYCLAPLLPGKYDITARREGFVPVKRESVEIIIGRSSVIDFVLIPEIYEKEKAVDRKSVSYQGVWGISEFIKKDLQNNAFFSRSMFRALSLYPGAVFDQRGAVQCRFSRPAEINYVKDGLSLNRALDGYPALDFPVWTVMKIFRFIPSSFGMQTPSGLGGTVIMAPRSGRGLVAFFGDLEFRGIVGGEQEWTDERYDGFFDEETQSQAAASADRDAGPAQKRNLLWSFGGESGMYDWFFAGYLARDQAEKFSPFLNEKYAQKNGYWIGTSIMPAPGNEVSLEFIYDDYLKRNENFYLLQNYMPMRKNRKFLMTDVKFDHRFSPDRFMTWIVRYSHSNYKTGAAGSDSDEILTPERYTDPENSEADYFPYYDEAEEKAVSIRAGIIWMSILDNELELGFDASVINVDSIKAYVGDEETWPDDGKEEWNAVWTYDEQWYAGSLFIQDKWLAMSKLTFQPGLRWLWFSPLNTRTALSVDLAITYEPVRNVILFANAGKHHQLPLTETWAASPANRQTGNLFGQRGNDNLLIQKNAVYEAGCRAFLTPNINILADLFYKIYNDRLILSEKVALIPEQRSYQFQNSGREEVLGAEFSLTGTWKNFSFLAGYAWADGEGSSYRNPLKSFEEFPHRYDFWTEGAVPYKKVDVQYENYPGERYVAQLIYDWLTWGGGQAAIMWVHEKGTRIADPEGGPAGTEQIEAPELNMLEVNLNKKWPLKFGLELWTGLHLYNALNEEGNSFYPCDGRSSYSTCPFTQYAFMPREFEFVLRMKF